MTKVLYKCYDVNHDEIAVVKTLAEAREIAQQANGHYEVFYTYRETNSVGYAWKFKRLSGHQT